MPPQVHVRELFRQRLTLSETDRDYETAWQVYKEDGGRPLPFTASEAVDAVHALHPIGSTLPDFDGVYLTRLAPQETAANIFEVTGTYTIPAVPPVPEDFDNFLSQSQSQRSPENPHGAKISMDITLIDEYDYRDLNGDWFTNTIGEPLQTLPPIKTTIEVWRVSYNSAALPNTGRVGWADGRDFFAGARVDAEMHLNKRTGVYTPYYAVTLEMWVNNRRDWSPMVVWNASYNQIEVKNGKKTRKAIRDPDTGDAYNTLQFITEDGKPLPAGSTAAHKLEFKVLNEGTFSIPFIKS
jgi:hypothetical protein